MFAICARMVPNIGLRVRRSAVTRTSAPSTVTVVPLRITCDSSLLAPFTRTAASSTVTVTPAGMATGRLPILDMTPSLPDLADELAAESRIAGLAVGHQSARRGNHRNTQTAHDARDAGLRHVHATTGLADPLDAGDDRRLVVRVLEVDPKQTLLR